MELVALVVVLGLGLALTAALVLNARLVREIERGRDRLVAMTEQALEQASLRAKEQAEFVTMVAAMRRENFTGGERQEPLPERKWHPAFDDYLADLEPQTAEHMGQFIHRRLNAGHTVDDVLAEIGMSTHGLPEEGIA
jgi:hypothetical protein